MANEVKITITAKDGASQTFVAVGQSADKMGKAVESSATKSSKSLKELQDQATKVGAGLGTLIGITSALGQAHVAEEQQIRALERAYGSSSETIEDLAEKLQSMGIASDDATRIAALGAQSLIKNYDLTADEVQQLIERSADLTQVTFDQFGKQLGLADVMQRVSAAMRGEAESAEILGVAMNDQRLATLAAEEGLLGWTTTMSDAEKAQFRLKVFLEDTASAQGAAAERSETLAGQMNAMKLQVLDAGAAFGGLLGPAAEAASVLGSFALAAPAVGAGLGRLATTLPAIGALTLALGPVGLVAGALAAGAGITYLIGRMNDYEDAAIAATAATGDLDNFFASLAASLSPTFQGMILDLNENLNAVIVDAANRQADLDKLMTLQLGITNAGIDIASEQAAQLAAETTGLTIEQLKWIDSNGDLIVTIDEVNKVVGDFQANLDRLNADQVKQVQTDIQSLFSKSNLDYEKAAAAVADLNAQLDAGAISPEAYVAAIREMTTNFGPYLDIVGRATEATAGWNQKLFENRVEMAQGKAEFSDWITELTGGARHTLEGAEAVDALTRSMHGAQAPTAAMVTYVSDFAQRTESEAIPASRELTAQIDALGKSLSDVGSSGLDRTFKAIVGSTNSMVGSIDTAKQWADALIAPVGTLSELDELYASNSQTYIDAQNAQISITEDHTRALEASQRIQIMQAPLIAEQTDATADYLEALSKKTVAEQQIALAYADQDIATRASDIATMAANYDTMTEAQKKAFEGTLEGAAAADPLLASILTNLGLINVTDGVITINDEALGGANDQMTDLTEAIENLADVIGMLMIDYTSADAASGLLGTLATQMANLDGKTATVYINGVRTGFVPGDDGYATGGMVNVRLAEMGPERLQFANGGSAIAPHDGNYLIPNGTYVSPAAATRAGGSGAGSPMVNVQNLYLTAATPDWHNQMLNNALQQGL